MGAAATTTYDVITRYLVDDKGARPQVQQLTQHVQTLERSASSSMGLLGKLGGAFAGYLGFQQAKKSLIDFNSNMEQAKITMAGLMEQAGRGKYEQNFEAAGTLVKQMQLDARASVGTTADFVQMASMLVLPLTQAGGSMENLRDMTRQTVVASRSMGIEAGVAARDIDQAMRGVYRSVDPFSGKILTPLGYGGEEGRRKFNAMSAQQRFAEIQRGLSSPGIAAMAKAQETSYAGAMSTAVDNLQMFLGKVGLPLFKGLTAELNKWNTWLDKNQALVDQIAKDMAGKILTAAVAFKDAIAWAADHWKQILGAVAVYKTTGAFLGLPGKAAEGASALGRFGTVGGGAGKLLAGTIVAEGIYIGATALADYIDERQTKGLAREMTGGDATLAGINAALTRFERAGTDAERAAQGRILWQQMAGAGGAGAYRDVLAERLNRMTQSERNAYEASAGLKPWRGGMSTDYGSSMIHNSAEAIAAAFMDRVAYTIRNSMPGAGVLDDGRPFWERWKTPVDPRLPNIEKAKVNVTINSINVATKDEDRFVLGMIRAFRKAAKDPGGVGRGIHALTEG